MTIFACACGDPLLFPPDQPPGPGDTPPPAVGLSSEERELVRLINEERATRGLEPLTVRQDLYCSVRRHSDDIGRAGVCGHTGTDGSSPGERLRTCGGTSWSGEIVACGQRTARGAVDSWLRSPGHSSTMLGRDKRFIGVAMTSNYWTAIFDTD